MIFGETEPAARTVDEMAHANQQVIFIADEDYDRITEERLARAEPTLDQD